MEVHQYKLSGEEWVATKELGLELERHGIHDGEAHKVTSRHVIRHFLMEHGLIPDTRSPKQRDRFRIVTSLLRERRNAQPQASASPPAARADSWRKL